MREIGFWDYTCPMHGSLSEYTESDYDDLLDDMVEGGFNSFVLCPKWVTTGYKSRYSWLDQDPGVSAIATGNAVIHHALQGARARGMKTWVLVVGNNFVVEPFGITPPNGSGISGSMSYDLDQPGVAERIIAVNQEVAELFGSETDGFIVELEFADRDAPHRIPLYNAWAKQNGRPDFAAIKDIVLEPRSYPFTDWRDFTTYSRIQMMKRIESAVRGTGFRGKMSSITELANGQMVVAGNTNLEMLKSALPDWSLVTYDNQYDRRVNRLATMDFCIEQPRNLGHDVQWLTRGIMTFTWPLDAPGMDLRAQWQMSLEDARTFKPETLWFMGADARSDGMVCSNVKLPSWGYADGRIARKSLMSMVREMGLTVLSPP